MPHDAGLPTVELCGHRFHKHNGNLYPDYLNRGNAVSFIIERAQRFCVGKGIDVGCGPNPFPGAEGVDDKPGCNAYDLPHADNSLDFVFSSHCIEHLHRWRDALAMWVRKVRPGGHVFVYAPHHTMSLWWPGGPWVGKAHVWQPTHAALCDELKRLGCDIVEANTDRDAYWAFHVVGRKRDAATNPTDDGWLANTFDRVVCINLDRRTDRMEQLTRKFAAAGWPFKAIERMAAVDGERVPPPPFWKQPAGSWGCYRSHLLAMEQAIRDGCSSILLLEDDAFPADDFLPRLRRFMGALPCDWDMLYLGGEHVRKALIPPIQVNPLVLRGRNVNRTHAWAVRGKAMLDVYHHLNNLPAWMASQCRHHIDWWLGELHETGQHKVYCPTLWLIGQAGFTSDISPVKVEPKDRTFDGSPVHVPPQKSFSHAGDLGDIIYGLPTVRALGGGRLLLGPYFTHVRDVMTQPKAENIATLLTYCPYLSSIEWQPERGDSVVLDVWRHKWATGKNLAEQHTHAYGISSDETNKPWLFVADPNHVADVIIHRSPRYHGRAFPWRDVLAKYAGRIAMVGAPDEHVAFCREFGDVPHVQTPTLGDLARVIAGAKLFIGNQSAPYAIAMGLGKLAILEVSNRVHDNCRFRRSNVQSFDGTANLVLPDV